MWTDRDSDEQKKQYVTTQHNTTCIAQDSTGCQLHASKNELKDVKVTCMEVT